MEKPRLLLDEDIGRKVADFLREKGYDVVGILEEQPGSSDASVLKRAFLEQRIVVTLDKDFGFLVYRNFQQHMGVILLRLEDESPNNINEVLKNILTDHSSKLFGNFIVASETKIRLR